MRPGDRLLLHICCAPCLAGPLKQLRAEGFEVAGFFYNPNIHPLLEFRRRLKSVQLFAECDPLPLTLCAEYGLEEFLREVYFAAPAPPERCRACYRLRLEKTAAEARATGAVGFSTTLFGSAHQDHELIRRVGAEAAAAHGVELVYRDFRPLAGYGEEVARRRQFYRQGYCGCVFSEEQRYRHTTQHLYRGSAPCTALPQPGAANRAGEREG